ncbi:DUF2087 domain-containing protein [Sinosporangium siamense]|uniref:DUF2087 domain-containing protein n=1 Tax=Sinosporangium siamense TaxID=1367973 RepID=UPI00194FEE36|nr:DUF2087 domain-containing protein [Sinosporangium siamense]
MSTTPPKAKGPEDHPPSCADLVGLLAQPDRRSAFAAVVLGATTRGQVVELTGLRPPAAANALRKLAEGRVIATGPEAGTYSLVEDTFRRAIIAEVGVAGRAGGDGSGAYFRRGRLRAIPGDAAVRSRVLRVVADTFQPGETYSEPQVNALCGEWFDDWAGLRRVLVDEGLLRRDATGTRYERP